MQKCEKTMAKMGGWMKTLKTNGIDIQGIVQKTMMAQVKLLDENCGKLACSKGGVMAKHNKVMEACSFTKREHDEGRRVGRRRSQAPQGHGRQRLLRHQERVQLEQGQDRMQQRQERVQLEQGQDRMQQRQERVQQQGQERVQQQEELRQQEGRQAVVLLRR